MNVLEFLGLIVLGIMLIWWIVVTFSETPYSEKSKGSLVYGLIQLMIIIGVAYVVGYIIIYLGYSVATSDIVKEAIDTKIF